ncbi:hypothetical protein ACFWUP_16290 [Nocardia sp. NPDC058658]|uniref:hypothetical protein n=1 Tax=Nocardia sp. NPDC058658 TaxID=3346580 RepID=UPI003646C701
MTEPSTPMQRQAARMQHALPEGWQVDIVDEPIPGGTGTRPVLHLHPPSAFVSRLFGYPTAA